MNILYIHGFASKYDANSSKVQTLMKLGKVFGYDIDYTKKPSEWVDGLVSFSIKHKIDLIVGTSLGGWTAALLSSKIGVPFVALNPSVIPYDTLLRYVGTNKTYYGEEYTLEEDVVYCYQPISKDGIGLILLEDGDEVLDAHLSHKMLIKHYETYIFSGGSHRFDSLDKQLDLINNFLNRVISVGVY